MKIMNLQLTYTNKSYTITENKKKKKERKKKTTGMVVQTLHTSERENKLELQQKVD